MGLPHCCDCGGGTGGGGGVVIGSTFYNPDPVAVFVTAANAFVDVSPALVVSFDAPTSGHVAVTLQALSVGVLGASLEAVVLWNLREGGANIPGTSGHVQSSIDDGLGTFPNFRLSLTVEITGLVPGSTHSYAWGHRVGTAGDAAALVAGGALVDGVDSPFVPPYAGAASMIVVALP